MPLLTQTLVSGSHGPLMPQGRLTALTSHQPGLAGEPRHCPRAACWLGGRWHGSGEAGFEAIGGIYGASLGLEINFDALQSRDSHSAKTLAWGLETLPKKESRVTWPTDIWDSFRSVILLPIQSRSGGSVTSAGDIIMSQWSCPGPLKAFLLPVVTLIPGDTHLYRPQTQEVKSGLVAVAQCAGESAH